MRFWQKWARRQDWPGLLILVLGILLVALAVFWVAVMGALLFDIYLGGALQLDELRTDSAVMPVTARRGPLRHARPAQRGLPAAAYRFPIAGCRLPIPQAQRSSNRPGCPVIPHLWGSRLSACRSPSFQRPA